MPKPKVDKELDATSQELVDFAGDIEIEEVDG
jgi:hypothetical protein